MLDLKGFQIDSAKQIAKRYAYFANHPHRPCKGRQQGRPFFQALSALTGAGKTPILAQAVTLMRAHFSSEPIVFWMSKAKSVVAQTYTNFSPNGKYCDIIDGFRVITVSQLTPQNISDSSSPLLIMATTSLFNNKEQSDGALNIYKRGADVFSDKSPWERLIERLEGNVRRPLLIVYDEGHNLSEQQTELLSELDPDAYFLASATLKLPSNFNKTVVQHIKLWVDENAAKEVKSFKMLGALNEQGEPDAECFITTAVDSKKVVDAQLVKKSIQFDGTTASMEKSLDDLMKRMDLLKSEIKNQGLTLKPKAIYLCKTNMADDGYKDDHTKPFAHRSAPPIRIWRYLVEEKGINPKKIAIYANLSFTDGNKPVEVNLFSKGENDFDEFQSGDYQHIIFNLSLQEGWDDPACYLAYIDKSMGSTTHVEQVIGRVLRQYDATHYESQLLNSAHFFIRVDNKNVFTEAIKGVEAKLLAEGTPIEIVSNFNVGSSGAEDLYPKPGLSTKLHHIHVDSEAATNRYKEIISEFPTFVEGSIDTQAQAHTATQVIVLKELGKSNETIEWNADGHTNPVRLRWLINTSVKARSGRAMALLNICNSKFDVRVQVQSNANRAAEKMASEIVEAFYQLAELVYESLKPFHFGVLRAPKTAMPFTNGLYERYAGLNKFELPFAKALDAIGLTWHRNSPNGGFFIPLLTEGETESFYPDFIVWKKDIVYCLDTKGSHLLTDAVARKLFDIQEDGKTMLKVRFITEGKQEKLRDKPIKGGYTVWKLKSGSPTPIYTANLAQAVSECLK